MCKFTVKDINALRPCKPAETWVASSWSGSLLDILSLSNVKDADKVWVVSRLLPKRKARLFACWCAEQALARVPSPDVRSLEAIEVARRYAYGKATDEELTMARATARKAWAATEAATEAAAEVTGRAMQVKYLKGVCK